MEEKQVKETGGRKRKNLVKFYLNDEEYKKLCENAETFGRDKSKYLRLVIQKELDKMGALASTGGGCLYFFFCLHHLNFLLQFFQNFVTDF